MDKLDEFVDQSNNRAMAMLLWKQRLANPEMSVIVTEQDIAGLEACAEYLEAVPAAHVYRPTVPGVGGKPAGKRDFVVISLVNQKNMDPFRAVENNEKDHKAAQDVARLRGVVDGMAELISRVRGGLARGETSDSELTELCDGAMTMAKVLRAQP